MDKLEMRQWVIKNGSGSLWRAIEEGMSWLPMALHERLAMEVASAAILVRPSRLTIGKVIAEPDDKVTTELGWYARTLRWRWQQMEVFKNATVKTVYFTLSCKDKEKKGAGFLIENLTLPWLPTEQHILIPLAFCKKGKWISQENPL